MATLDDLTNSTTALLNAVNVQKATLDTAVATATTQATIATGIATGLSSYGGTTSTTLTAAQVTNTVIDNVGQAAAVDLTLPVAGAGMNFLMICGEANAYKWRIRANATDKIYLNGVAGSDNGYVGITTPTIGAYLSVFSFKTGASTYDWMAVVGNGAWGVV